MKEVAPDYYTLFHCIAEKCRHSCCIGWEIDVDEDSLAVYRSLTGSLGDEIRASIVTEDDCSHFQLLLGDRCPFLDDVGLCRLISAYGDGILCQICRDHPRFRNEFSHCTEIGLGLSCEAAAELILTQEMPMTLITLSNGGGAEEPEEFETYLLSLRQQLLALLADESWTIDERLQNILDFCGISLPYKTWEQWANIYHTLERLDTAWDTVLDTLTQPQKPIDSKWDSAFRNLAAYFLFRHLPAALYDGEEAAYISFAVFSTQFIRQLFAAAPSQDLVTLVDLCRMYSSEIEYSTENTDSLLEYFVFE